MDGNECQRTIGEPEVLPAHPADRYDFSEQTAAGRRAQRNDRRRPYYRPLMIEPPFATLDLIGIRPLVQPTLASCLEFEVLDRVGDENVRAGNSRPRQRLIEDATGGPNEGLSGDVFLVARLFSNQHKLGTTPSFARHNLSRESIEWAARAVGFGGGQRRETLDWAIEQVLGHC